MCIFKGGREKRDVFGWNVNCFLIHMFQNKEQCLKCAKKKINFKHFRLIWALDTFLSEPVRCDNNRYLNNTKLQLLFLPVSHFPVLLLLNTTSGKEIFPCQLCSLSKFPHINTFDISKIIIFLLLFFIAASPWRAPNKIDLYDVRRRPW